MDHLQAATNFSGEDLLYGQQQPLSVGPSPGYVQSEHPSNSSHSNQPTPSSSNRPGSYSNFTPPQPNQSAFSPPATGSSVTDVPLFGSNLGGNMAMPSEGEAQPWNFTAVHHQNKPSQESGGNGARQNQGQTPNQQQSDMGFGGFSGGGTGMTPGATGMTPLPDSLWQSVNEGPGSEWMYGWGGTPQQ
jgi:hypothetical protein